MLSTYAPYLSLGLEIAVGITLPILTGYWLDNYFGVDPWLLLVGCVVGMGNIFVIIIHISKRFKNDS